MSDDSGFDPLVDRADRDRTIDADDVEDAIATAFANLARGALEADGPMNSEELFGAIEYDPLVEASEYDVQSWIDGGLAQLQADHEIEFVGTEGGYRLVEGSGEGDDGDV